MRRIDRPEPSSTPERAMDLLLEKVRLVFGEQDWSAWEWSVREYGTAHPRVMAFAWREGTWTPVSRRMT